MNMIEMGKFLTAVALIDNRRPTEEACLAWLAVLGEDITLDEAHEAHRAFRREEPGTYLEPGHIYRRVHEKRREARSWDRGIARPPAPPGKTYAVDVIEFGELEQ